MVQILNDEFSGNVFGRLGKGIGKGLSEQIPKEIERTRLASGLKKFEQESKGLSPLQQFTRAAAIPGITPEHLYTMAPLLRQEAARQEGLNRTGQGNVAQEQGNQSQPSVSSAPASPNNQNAPFQEAETNAGGKRSLKTLENTRAQLAPIVRKSPQELFSEAALLSQQNPITYPTPQDAMQFVQQNEEARVANLQEQKNVGNVADALSQNIKSGLENVWGKENTAKGIPGTVQTKLLRNVENDLADPKNKLSEQQLVDKWGEVGKRLAKANTNLDEKSRYGWLGSGLLGKVANYYAGRTPEDIVKTINNVKKVYQEADALEEFQDIIATKFDLSSAGAAHFAYPGKNASVDKYINTLKVPQIPRSEKGIAYPVNTTKESIEAADKISGMLGDEDSILSYAMKIKAKGLDPRAFINRLDQNEKAGLFKPSARQFEELQKGYPAKQSMGDIYLYTLTDQDKMVEQ